jgi:hypothetical protein
MISNLFALHKSFQLNQQPLDFLYLQYKHSFDLLPPINRLRIQFSMKEQNLILQPYHDCNILPKRTGDEILPNFSVVTALTVDVAIISNFSVNGTLPILQPPFTIDWVLQVLVYGLSLPTLYQETLQKTISILSAWITRSDNFKDDEIFNIYFQRIFRYLSQILNVNGETRRNSSRIDLIINNLVSCFEHQMHL